MKQEIIEDLREIFHPPFLFFASQSSVKEENTLLTLKLLAQETQVTAGRIAEVLDIRPSSVTQIIKKLEETGTVRRVKSKEDARVVLVEITELGLNTLSEQKTITSDIHEEFFQGFSEEELQNLSNYLKRIKDNIHSESFNQALEDIFSDEKRWERFAKMSAKFGRQRDKFMDQPNFGNWRNRPYRDDHFPQGHRR